MYMYLNSCTYLYASSHVHVQYLHSCTYMYACTCSHVHVLEFMYLHVCKKSCTCTCIHVLYMILSGKKERKKERKTPEAMEK